MRTALLFGLFAVLACGKDSPTPTQLQGQGEDWLDARALRATYDEDVAAADVRYKDRWVRISGTVETVTQSGDASQIGFATTTPAKSPPVPGVVASFSGSYKEPLANLKAGEAVTIRGKCRGLMPSANDPKAQAVNLADCEVLPIKPPGR